MARNRARSKREQMTILVVALVITAWLSSGSIDRAVDSRSAKGVEMTDTGIYQPLAAKSVAGVICANSRIISLDSIHVSAI